MKKSLVSILLAVVMVVSGVFSVSFSAYAADATYEARIKTAYYTKFEDAFNALKSGEVLVVLKDVTLEDCLAKGQAGNLIVEDKYTIDLNGYTLTFADGSAGGDYDGMLEFYNVDITIEDGTINDMGNISGSNICILDNAIANITDVTINCKKNKASWGVILGDDFSGGACPNVTMTNVTVNANNIIGMQLCVGDYTLNNCTIIGKYDGTNTKITGNTALAVCSGADVTVNGGSCTAIRTDAAGGTNDVFAGYIYNSGGTITVNGAEFTAKKYDDTSVGNNFVALRMDNSEYSVGWNGSPNYGGPSIITVNDGTIVGRVYNSAKDSGFNGFWLKGGTYDREPQTDFYAYGYHKVNVSGNTWVVSTEYAVSFDANEGAGEIPATFNWKAGTQIDLPSGDGLTRDGYTFLGWNTDENATSGLLGVTMPNSDTTFYAIWAANDVVESVEVTAKSDDVKNVAVPTQDSLNALKDSVAKTVAVNTEVIVEAVEDTTVAENELTEGQLQIKNAVTENKNEEDVAFTYLDLSVVKVNTATSEREYITNTGDVVLELVYDFDLGTKTGLSVYRSHNGELTTFTRTDTGEDGTFYYDAVNKKIHIFSNKFSDYVITTEDMPVDIANAKYYASLTLNNSIDINFILRGCNFDATKLAKLHVYANDVEFSTKLRDGSDVEGVIMSVAPKDMRESIHVKVVFDGVLVKEFDYSVRKYCDSVISKNTNAKLVKLCYATLAYGVAAENWFYEDSPIAEEESVGYGLNTAAMTTALAGFDKTPSESKSETVFPDDVDNAFAQLVPGSKLSLKFYISTEKDYGKDNLFVFNSDGLRISDSNMEVEHTDDGYTVTVCNISADRILKSYSLRIKGLTEDDFIVTYSVSDYCYTINTDGDYNTNTLLTGLTSAIYVYGQAATAYGA